MIGTQINHTNDIKKRTDIKRQEYYVFTEKKEKRKEKNVIIMSVC